MNKVQLVGRLTHDPELKRTQGGKSVTAFAIAIDDGYGENKKTHFIDCVAWEKIAETICRYCNKGDQVITSGRLQVRFWEDKNGSKHKATEVVLDGFEFGAKAKSNGNKTAGANVEFCDADISDDELPF